MTAESDNPEDFLESTEVIDWRNAEILDAARSIAGSSDSDVEVSRRLFEWVRDSIPHSKDAGVECVTCKASDVLRQRTGICYAKSHLLAAMLRAMGIPAGFGYQLLCADPPYAGMVLHGFNGVFLRSQNRWFRVDCRGNTGSIDAQFWLGEERLAFPPDASRGEYTDDRIFRAPLPDVIRCLTNADSVTSMWRGLPNKLPASPPDC